MASVLTPASDEGQFCDTEVTLEDQKKINRFARLNVKDEELDTMLKSLKRQLENIEEASNELMLADEDDLEDDDLGGDSNEAAAASSNSSAARAASNIHFRIGESYVAVNKDEAEILLEEKRKELQCEIKDLQSRIDPMKEEMSNIKAKLYAKFGNNINLDNDEDK